LTDFTTLNMVSLSCFFTLITVVAISSNRGITQGLLFSKRSVLRK